MSTLSDGFIRKYESQFLPQVQFRFRKPQVERQPYPFLASTNMVKSLFSNVIFFYTVLLETTRSCQGQLATVPKRYRNENERSVTVDEHDMKTGNNERKLSAGAFGRSALRNRRQLVSDLSMSMPITAASFEFSISMPGDVTTDGQNWINVLNDDFQSGFGAFNKGGRGVSHKDEAQLRSGVIRISKNGSSVYSNRIETTYSMFRVQFSVLAIGMDHHDSFCLDYSVSDGFVWFAEKCWYSHDDFEIGLWNDNITSEFEALNIVDNLRIRLRTAAESNFDEVYIDNIKLDVLA